MLAFACNFFGWLFGAIRHPKDLWNYMAGLSGLTASIVGVIDANAIQVWGGAIVAVLAVVWGFWRDQRRHDRVEEHAEKQRKRADEWEEFALSFRKRKMIETGEDPFKDGIPPLRPFDEAEKKEPAPA